jgi:dethiobiotin synthetase
MRGVFIAGTDTDVGKTYVGALIAKSLVSRGISIGAYKPVASGYSDWAGSDGQKLWDSIGRGVSLEDVSPQRFRAPLAPPVAASLENREVNDQQILDGYRAWEGRCDFLLVEGAGGLCSPVSKTWTNAHLVERMRLPILLVTAWRLGVVNQVITTLLAAHAMNLDVQGIVLNEVHAGAEESHVDLLREAISLPFPAFSSRRNPPRILCIRYRQEHIDLGNDWEQLFSPASA